VYNYGQLLAYKEIVQKVSDIVGEEVTKSAQQYLDQINEKVDQLDLYIRGIRDQMEELVYIKNNFNYPIELFFDDFNFNFSEIKSSPHKSLDLFNEKMKKVLGSEWGK